MKKLDIRINNREGLHARPASRLVSLCHSYDSDISISSGDARANGKNITEVLALGVEKGGRVTIVIRGSDEEKAWAALKKMLDHDVSGMEKY